MNFNDKKLVYALRHSPEKFGLAPDQYGWVDLQSFLDVMNITKEQLDLIIVNMDKKRLEIKGDKIRAAYGHSFANKVQQTEARPPDILYHGTPSFSAFVIKRGSQTHVQTVCSFVHKSENGQDGRTKKAL